MSDMTATVAPNGEQANADDFQTGPRTFTIIRADVVGGDQPVHVYLDGFDPKRPWKPNKSMRRVLIEAWGPDSANYAGKRVTLFRDPDVTFGRDRVGGIKVSHLSHLKDGKQLKVALTVTRGKRSLYTVDPLPDAPTPKRTKASDHMDRLADAFRAAKIADALWLDRCTNVLLRPVKTPTDLSPEDADKVIAALEADAQDGDGLLEVGQ